VRRRFFAFVREAIRRTIWAIGTIIGWLDKLLLPHVLKLVLPGVEDPPSIPLLGMLFTFVVIILLGVIARHLLGGEFQRAWERLLARVPVARSIYGGVKQLVEAIFASSNQASRFNRVVASLRSRSRPAPQGASFRR